VAGYWGGRIALSENHHEDLWIYSSGAWFAFHGKTPYDVQAMHARVDERYPGDQNLDGNNGFFLTPQAVLVMAPFAALPWDVSKAAWCAAMVILGAGVGWKLRWLTDRTLPAWFTAAVVVFVLLNWLSMFVLVVGQTPLLTLGCVVIGQAVYRKGWKRAGCLLWAVAFIKPHLALPLIPLAWYLSGWKRAAEVVLWAAVLNVTAGLVFYGNPLFVLDYLAYVQKGHQTVEFNRVGVNKQITGWNRLLVAGGGPAVDLGMIGTLAGSKSGR
jgi:hypothetical protein